jgi:hypothetical protein
MEVVATVMSSGNSYNMGDNFSPTMGRWGFYLISYLSYPGVD